MSLSHMSWPVQLSEILLASRAEANSLLPRRPAHFLPHAHTHSFIYFFYHTDTWPNQQHSPDASVCKEHSMNKKNENCRPFGVTPQDELSLGCQKCFPCQNFIEIFIFTRHIGLFLFGMRDPANSARNGCFSSLHH